MLVSRSCEPAEVACIGCEFFARCWESPADINIKRLRYIFPQQAGKTAQNHNGRFGCNRAMILPSSKWRLPYIRLHVVLRHVQLLGAIKSDKSASNMSRERGQIDEDSPYLPKLQVFTTCPNQAPLTIGRLSQALRRIAAVARRSSYEAIDAPQWEE